MKDSLTVKVYNKTYITVPSDTNNVSVVVNNNSNSYRYEVWGFLLLFLLFIVVYWFKKSSVTINNTTQPKPIMNTEALNKTKEIKKHFASKKVEYTHSLPDVSKLGEINIKNEKL